MWVSGTVLAAICLIGLILAPASNAVSDRGIELVSPPDKRPAEAVEIADPIAAVQLFFQAAKFAALDWLSDLQWRKGFLPLLHPSLSGGSYIGVLARTAVAVPLLSLLILGLFWGNGSASAAGVRLFKETFGSAAQPTFTRPMSVAVDQSTGDVLVLDGGGNEVQKLASASFSTPSLLHPSLSGVSYSRWGHLRQLALGAVVFAAMLACSQAVSQAAMVRPLVGNFGSAAQPTFSQPQALAVDQDSGDLLVIDAGAGTVSRFKPDGEPDPFSALGTNVIDGKTRPGGKPCAEEPASCDATSAGYEGEGDGPRLGLLRVGGCGQPQAVLARGQL